MQNSSKARLAWLWVLPVAFYFFLAWPGLHGPFVFDDFPNLAALSNAGPVDSWRRLGIYLAQTPFVPGRPLAMLSFLPQQAHWPDNPFPFKFVNLALHGINAGLLFLLLRRLSAQFTDVSRARWIAAVAAFAWLVHPMQLSTVFLVIQRMTLLATSFMFLGLLAYLHGVLAEAASPRRRAAWMGAGLAGGTLLAVLCKENGALLPLLALVVDATLLRPRIASLPRGLLLWRRVLIFPAVVVVAGFLLMQLPSLGDVIAHRDFTLGERLLTQPRVLADYLYKSIVPGYSRYAVFNDDFAISRSLLQPWTTLPAILALLGALAAAIAWRRTRPLFAFGVLWFLAGHLIEAGPLSLEMYFEHRNYLPLAGVIFAVVAGLATMPSPIARQRAAWLGGAWFAACLFATALYAQVWSTPSRLALFWAEAHPASPRAQMLLAEDLFNRGRTDEARFVVGEVIAMAPDDPAPMLTALQLDCLLGVASGEEVAAIEQRLPKARFTIATLDALGDLRGFASSKACGKAMDEAAWLRLSDRLLANPAYASGPTAGRIHYQRHDLAVARGDLDTAIAELDATEHFDPEPDLVRLKARYLADAGLVEDAVRQLEQYDGSRRTGLRRWLVDDEAIDREIARDLRARKPPR